MDSKRLIDKQTDREYHVLIPTQRKLKVEYIQMFQETLRHVASNPRLTGQAFRVFLMMLGHMEFENYVKISQTQLAKDLGMYRPDVSKAVKMLVQESVLFEGPKVGSCKTYRVNPNVGWKGNVATFDSERKKYPRLASELLGSLRGEEQGGKLALVHRKVKKETPGGDSPDFDSNNPGEHIPSSPSQETQASRPGPLDWNEIRTSQR